MQQVSFQHKNGLIFHEDWLHFLLKNLHFYAKLTGGCGRCEGIEENRRRTVQAVLIVIVMVILMVRDEHRSSAAQRSNRSAQRDLFHHVEMQRLCGIVLVNVEAEDRARACVRAIL